jgi:hypothetical protein
MSGSSDLRVRRFTHRLKAEDGTCAGRAAATGRPDTHRCITAAIRKGYEERQKIRTLLNDMDGSYISIYVRLPFTLTGAQIASLSQLRAEVSYDDGFVLYLNGTRVADSATMDGDPPAYDESGGPEAEPPTPFDRFLDEASAALLAEGFGDGRRDGIKQFVRDRRASIILQLQSMPPDKPPIPRR